MVSAFTPNAKNHEGLGPLASRLVHVNDMPWEPIRYPGCHVKTLMVDKKSGLLTVLLKMDPGAELPDHEHVMLEQTFMIEGRLGRQGWTRERPILRSRRVCLASCGQPSFGLDPRRRADDCHLPDSQQVLREGR